MCPSLIKPCEFCVYNCRFFAAEEIKCNTSCFAYKNSHNHALLYWGEKLQCNRTAVILILMPLGYSFKAFASWGVLQAMINEVYSGGKLHWSRMCKQNVVLNVTFAACCRGKGDYFRLGHGTDVHVRKPQVVEGLRGKKIVHVAVGALHCLAVTDTGQVCCASPSFPLFPWCRKEYTV